MPPGAGAAGDGGGAAATGAPHLPQNLVIDSIGPPQL